MGRDAQIAMWLIAVLIPVVLNLPNRRDPDAIGLSAMLGLIWLMSNVLYALYTPPESMRLFPVLDLIGGLTAYIAWRTRRAWWKAALAWSFVALLLLHCAFWLRYVLDPGGADLGWYVAALNVVCALQLVCMGVGPRARYLGSGLVTRLRRGPGLGDPAPRA